MDVNLGGYLDGVMAARSIRRLYPDVKVVMISSSVDDFVVSAARQAGASGYLAKDLQPDEVVRSLHALTDERRAVSSPAGSDRIDRIESGPRANAERERENSWLGRLTLREREVLAGIRQGRTNRDIAVRLGISVNTINKHVQHLLKKLKVKNRAQAATLLGQLDRAAAQDMDDPMH
jgi:two-component system nitrate/nitrite response regulator NarL